MPMTRVLLIGAGHAHAVVLDAWRTRAIPGVEIILVTPITQAPYSGMIPGWLAGQYSFEDSVVDFTVLSQRAGVRLIQAELVKLQAHTNTVSLSDGQSLSYDWLSLNVGSTLVAPTSEHATVLAMRPLSTLRARYDNWLTHWQNNQDPKPLRLTAAGGGAAGVESLLCVKHRLQTLRPDKAIHAQLVTRSSHILPGFSASARRLALAALHRAEVTMQLGTDWRETIGQRSDLVIWATGAQPHAWQQDPDLRGTLKTDSTGFVSVDPYLRSVSHPNIFAVGDCAALPTPAPKAGVYAVRMGATLMTNLNRSLTGKPLAAFKPQQRALALLNTADGRAIASWGRMGWQGRWVMRGKDWIDRRFITKLSC